jgi:hypothetical protein
MTKSDPPGLPASDVVEPPSNEASFQKRWARAKLAALVLGIPSEIWAKNVSNLPENWKKFEHLSENYKRSQTIYKKM